MARLWIGWNTLATSNTNVECGFELTHHPLQNPPGTPKLRPRIRV
jgi:hypothetical protein